MTELSGVPLNVEAESGLPVADPAPAVVREFSIGQVLTLGCSDTEAQQMFCAYADLLDVLGFMLADVPLAQDIPAAIEECRPAVLAQHPGLAAVGPPSHAAPDAAVLSWLSAQEQEHGATLPLTPLVEEVDE